MEHVRDDLSAYLDSALAPARRSEVDAHLGTCPPCRKVLAELRSTARLIAALPAAVPSRRLVPSLAPRASACCRMGVWCSATMIVSSSRATGATIYRV